MIEQVQVKPESTLTARIVRRILDAAERGEYSASERLPSERELAEQLAVSRNTVTAAYAELEDRGIIRRIQGKGAYLCALPRTEEAFSWGGKISRYANALDEPVLELLARRCADQSRHPFSAGTPSLDVFSKEMYSASVNRVLDEAIPAALAVAPTEGQWQLRQAIGSWLGLSPENIMITAGAQEGIDLIARCVVEPGDYVVIDSPAYSGAAELLVCRGAPSALGYSLVDGPVGGVVAALSPETHLHDANLPESDRAGHEPEDSLSGSKPRATLQSAGGGR